MSQRCRKPHDSSTIAACRRRRSTVARAGDFARRDRGEAERLSADRRRPTAAADPDRAPVGREPGLGLAPGIQVALNVLSRASDRPIRHNSTRFDFCIRGPGPAVVAGSASTSSV